MSPEQARGLAVDARSDQFAFGVVLYEMLAGVRPFQGSTSIEVLSAILRSAPAPLRGKAPRLPDRVLWVVDRCLAKDPGDRYASTLDLARDIRDAREALADRSGAFPVAGPRGGRHRAAAGVAIALLVALAFGAGQWTSTARDDRTFREELASRTFRRATERRLGARRPDVSPSGLQLAYAGATEGGDGDIFVQSIAGGRPVSITSDRPGDDDEPAWSPDGSLIAFRSSRDGGGLFVVEPLGGSPRRITTFGHDPAWHPDGRRVVFATAATQSPYARLGGRSELWAVDLGTGALRRLYEGDAMQPAVSPNGLRVAFWARRRGLARRDVFTIPMDPGAAAAPVAVTDDEAVDWSPFWSADGRHLRYASDRDGTMNLWQVDVDEASGRPGGAPEPLPVPAASAGPFRASRDRRTIVYEAGTTGFDLERVPLGAGGLPSGPPGVLVSDAEGMSEPHVSPDGRLVAFSSFLATEDLWVVGTDGHGLRRVTAGPFRDRAPSFSADGTRLLFHSDRSGKFEVWKVLLDGGGLVPFTRCPDEQPFGAFSSPDGKLVAAYVGSVGTSLLPAGRPPEDPLPPPLPAPGPGLLFQATSFSHDGRLLAGHAIAADESYAGAWLFDVAAGSFRPLAAEGAWPRFAPGDRRLYLLRQRAPLSRGSLALVDLDDGALRSVLEERADVPAVAFDLAPDGSALYVVRERSRRQVWIGKMR
jgi:Tol biopolymer transport system component